MDFKNIEESIHKHCETVCSNITELSNKEFALVRKSGLGASDASVFLGLMTKFNKDQSTLVEEKCCLEYTETDEKIANLPQVRRGRDLEPMILTRAGKLLETTLYKPTSMYRVKKHPFLTINFDGVGLAKDGIVYPVEAKAPTAYADKYWQWGKAIAREPFSEFNGEDHLNLNFDLPKDSIINHAEKAAENFGVPGYYYAQIQQQFFGCDAPSGFIAALREKDWCIYLFLIPRNEWFQNKIVTEGYKTWTRIENRKGLTKIRPALT